MNCLGQSSPNHLAPMESWVNICRLGDSKRLEIAKHVAVTSEVSSNTLEDRHDEHEDDDKTAKNVSKSFNLVLQIRNLNYFPNPCWIFFLFHDDVGGKDYDDLDDGDGDDDADNNKLDDNEDEYVDIYDDDDDDDDQEYNSWYHSH